MALMHGNSDILETDGNIDDIQEDKYKKATRFRKKYLDVCQNIIYVMSNKLLQADAALTKKSLMKMDPITGAVPPENLVTGRHVQFGRHNLDS